VAVKSILLDRGRSVIQVYPEVEVVNARGERVRVPSETPVSVRVSMSRDRNASAELPGQVDVKIIRCVARTAPVGSWVRVVYAGEARDVEVEEYVPKMNVTPNAIASRE
jgi:hypothetical protein